MTRARPATLTLLLQGAGPSVFQVAKAGNKVEGGFFPEPPQPRQPQAAALPPPAAAAARQPRGAVDWAPPLDLERVDQYPEATDGGCSRCDSLSFNAEWLRAFAVTLCSQCKRQESLISKVRCSCLSCTDVRSSQSAAVGAPAQHAGRPPPQPCWRTCWHPATAGHCVRLCKAAV